MAHDFLGTFNKSQLDRLVAHVRAQGGLVQGRILHLETEKNRIGLPVFKYDEKGVPIGYSVDPPTSYIAKLMVAYEVLGGDPFYDLNLRLRTSPVYKQAGSEMEEPELMSNGEVIGAQGLADGVSATAVQELKAFVPDTLYWRRERLERKIRRALDYFDQLDAESQALQLMQLDDSATGSVENLYKYLTELIADPTYRAIYDDKGKDPNGKLPRAPFSSYEPNAAEGSPSYMRGEGGIYEKGEAPRKSSTGTT